MVVYEPIIKTDNSKLHCVEKVKLCNTLERATMWKGFI